MIKVFGFLKPIRLGRQLIQDHGMQNRGNWLREVARKRSRKFDRTGGGRDHFGAVDGIGGEKGGGKEVALDNASPHHERSSVQHSLLLSLFHLHLTQSFHLHYTFPHSYRSAFFISAFYLA